MAGSQALQSPPAMTPVGRPTHPLLGQISVKERGLLWEGVNRGDSGLGRLETVAPFGDWCSAGQQCCKPSCIHYNINYWGCNDLQFYSYNTVFPGMVVVM